MEALQYNNTVNCDIKLQLLPSDKNANCSRPTLLYILPRALYFLLEISFQFASFIVYLCQHWLFAFHYLKLKRGFTYFSFFVIMRLVYVSKRVRRIEITSHTSLHCMIKGFHYFAFSCLICSTIFMIAHYWDDG